VNSVLTESYYDTDICTGASAIESEPTICSSEGVHGYYANYIYGGCDLNNHDPYYQYGSNFVATT
jgi:hypothetical protein